MGTSSEPPGKASSTTVSRGAESCGSKIETNPLSVPTATREPSGENPSVQIRCPGIGTGSLRMPLRRTRTRASESPKTSVPPSGEKATADTGKRSPGLLWQQEIDSSSGFQSVDRGGRAPDPEH